MTRKELNDTIRNYREGFDDGYRTGLMREEGDAVRDNIDTFSAAYRLGYDHGCNIYAEGAEQ
jgi:hypothetical protein